jgi:hypothetical protein
VLLTSFLLEALLTRDIAYRRRLEDGFAFRTFVAAMMDRLLEIAGREPVSSGGLIARAADPPAAFAAAAAQVAELVQAADTVQPDAYQRNYIDFGGGLKDLGRNYIRLFARGRDEMASVYLELLDLAGRWEYMDALSSGARRAAEESRGTSDLQLIERDRARYADAERAALSVAQDTATTLAGLSTKATLGGMPASP